jgi:hypothetical protein
LNYDVFLCTKLKQISGADPDFWSKMVHGLRDLTMNRGNEPKITERSRYNRVLAVRLFLTGDDDHECG